MEGEGDGHEEGAGKGNTKEGEAEVIGGVLDVAYDEGADGIAQPDRSLHEGDTHGDLTGSDAGELVDHDHEEREVEVSHASGDG